MSTNPYFMPFPHPVSLASQRETKADEAVASTPKQPQKGIYNFPDQRKMSGPTKQSPVKWGCICQGFTPIETPMEEGFTQV